MTDEARGELDPELVFHRDRRTTPLPIRLLRWLFTYLPLWLLT